MSSAKHTPGTWRIEGHRHDPRSGKKSYLISAGENVYGDGPQDYVGYCEFSEADTRMAIAAPDFLRELCKAESFIAGFEGDELQEGIAELLTGIRLAIAKSEGRS